MAETALILDLDGTVWDSYPFYADVLVRAAEIPVSDSMRSLADGESIVRLLQRAGVTRTQFVRWVNVAMSDKHLYPGMREVLGHFKAEKTMLGVVTSLPGWIAEPMLTAAGVRDCFPCVVHAGSGVRRKPNPAGILHVLEQMRTKPSDRVFYVGDQLHDSQAASSAAVSFAWAAYGYGGEAPKFITACANTPRDLLDL